MGNIKTTLSNWGSLKWTVQELSKDTVFLDLNVQIKGRSILTSTFQKTMNLYLYIPPLSAHPRSCFKGLIIGVLQRYWIQNNSSDFKQILVKFITRLTERGHSLQNLTPLIKNAAANLPNKATSTNQSKDTEKTLYIHWKYHSHGLQSTDIWQAFNNTLKGSIPTNMQIAFSRQKNLRDILTWAALNFQENLKIQDLLAKPQSLIPHWLHLWLYLYPDLEPAR